MAATILTSNEYYTLFMTEIRTRDLTGKLTDDSPGSVLDMLAGATSLTASELSELILIEFAKTFLDSADGPEVTGGADDLQTLAVDHFGEDFARPQAEKAIGTLNFSRPNTDAGNVTILAGTEVSTSPTAAGQTATFKTTETVTMYGTSVDAAAECDTAGTDGNVDADTLTVLGSTLTDPSVTVNNDEDMSGGTAAETDAEYRVTIRNKILSLKGATLAGVVAAAEEVPGVEHVALVEEMMIVTPCDTSGDPLVPGEWFRIPVVTLYIADENGDASSALLDEVRVACEAVRAAGVVIRYAAADSVDLDWTASITLDVDGPNYDELVADPTLITDAMRAYVAALPVGADFVRATARTAILAAWGAGGTGDLTDFSTSSPAGDVVTGAAQKLIPGDMEIV